MSSVWVAPLFRSRRRSFEHRLKLDTSRRTRAIGGTPNDAAEVLRWRSKPLEASNTRKSVSLLVSGRKSESLLFSEAEIGTERISTVVNACHPGEIVAPGRSPKRWEESFFDQRSPDPDDIGVIHCQDDSCCPSDGGSAYQVGSIPAKASLPLVPSRVEELGELPRQWVDTGDVRSLVTVIVEAGEGQVAESRGPAMLAGDDMVDRVRDRAIVHLRHSAIFTDIARPLSHLTGHGGNRCRFSFRGKSVSLLISGAGNRSADLI